MEVIRVVPLDEISGQLRLNNDTLVFTHTASDTKEDVFSLSLRGDQFFWSKVYQFVLNLSDFAVQLPNLFVILLRAGAERASLDSKLKHKV